MQKELEKIAESAIVATVREKLRDDVEKRKSRSQPKNIVVTEAVVAQQKTYALAAESVSQKTKTQHVELYKGYVESFNNVSAKIDAQREAKANSNSSELRSLKKDEAYLTNAIYLHELYFANCFDPKSEIFHNMLCHMRLERDFGSFDDWQNSFIDCAMSVREGWAVCVYNTYQQKFVNLAIDGHDTSVMIGSYPVIAIDMWTHARKDYENDAKSYFFSQMRELNWVVIDERFQRAEKIAEALKLWTSRSDDSSSKRSTMTHSRKTEKILSMVKSTN